ncbi:hypothetical protein N3K66_005612 [Trichothecium roseum]|uniref:Uncharacterized protein n=1 Tax=Trichothecium roseum TaxID=47278 RepID=A0ACC0UYG9_9HYPO|nr:hypothetical protein N3K66_005612 [Trichothecium roseum]
MCKETIWKCPECLYTRHDSWTTCVFGQRAAASATARGVGAPGPFACPNYFRGHEWCAETKVLDACPNARYHRDFASPDPATATATSPTIIDEEKAEYNADGTQHKSPETVKPQAPVG